MAPAPSAFVVTSHRMCRAAMTLATAPTPSLSNGAANAFVLFCFVVLCRTAEKPCRPVGDGREVAQHTRSTHTHLHTCTPTPSVSFFSFLGIRVQNVWPGEEVKTGTTTRSYRSRFGDDYFAFWCRGVRCIVLNSQARPLSTPPVNPSPHAIAVVRALLEEQPVGYDRMTVA